MSVMKKKRIAFQVAHNRAHHYHIARVVDELLSSRYQDKIEVMLIYINDEDLYHLKDLLVNKDGAFEFKVNMYKLRCFDFECVKRWFRQQINNIFFPYRNFVDYQFVILNIYDFIYECDSIVLTDLIHGSCVKKYAPNTKVVWAQHGPVINKRYINSCDLSDVDIIWSPGEITTESFRNARRVVNVGSLKLDWVKEFSKREKSTLFNNGNLTAIYNPHFNVMAGGESWKELGIELLSWFSKRSELNLIFAPHPRLKDYFNLNTVDKFRAFPNIYIDLETKNLSNLYYESKSDIYIGDISSQVFEYIYIKPRPLFFFKSKNSGEDIKAMQSLGVEFSSVTNLFHSIGKEFPQEKIEQQSEFINSVFYRLSESPVHIAINSLLK
ncbi:hypothetical protein ACE1OI_003438 [Vibrio cholerae]|uniref:hypothetical protein n=1 Tax=Vibrio cholerae TaxID=666 RepID=UPI0035AB4C46